MSWLISRALMEDYATRALCRAGGGILGGHLLGWRTVCANVMPTPHPFWRNDKMMDASSLSRFGLTCAVLKDLGAAF